MSKSQIFLILFSFYFTKFQSNKNFFFYSFGGRRIVAIRIIRRIIGSRIRVWCRRIGVIIRGSIWIIRGRGRGVSVRLISIRLVTVGWRRSLEITITIIITVYRSSLIRGDINSSSEAIFLVVLLTDSIGDLLQKFILLELTSQDKVIHSSVKIDSFIK